MNVDSLINNVSDPDTRRALKGVFDQLKSDLDSLQAAVDANKTSFDDHTHVLADSTVISKPATDAAGNSNGSRETFDSWSHNLK
jgi:hypothetical protein